MSGLFTPLPKVKSPTLPASPPVPTPIATPKRPDVGQFIASVTSTNTLNPGLQARSTINSGAVAPDSPAIQQQAFQNKLDELNKWSKGQTVQLSSKRAKQAAYQTTRAQQYPAAYAVRGAGNATSGGRGVSNRAGWGGYANGQIPSNALSGLSFARGAMLRSDAASALERLNVAFRQQFGRNIAVTDSYRSLAGQQRLAATKPGLAARPGTSIHGLGLALDLGGGINRAGSPENQWLNQNGPQYGFVNPDWARSATRFEPWHWEYTG